MNCINYEKPSRHSVDVGYFKKNEFYSKYSAGVVQRAARQGFFRLCLDIFPHAEYFIVKDDLSDFDYTIFSVIKKTEDGYDFERAIGSATVEHDIKSREYLKMWLPLLKIELVMSTADLDEECEDGMLDEENILEFRPKKCA